MTLLTPKERTLIALAAIGTIVYLIAAIVSYCLWRGLMSWAHATQLAIGLLLVFGSAYTWWPRKRNRHVTLPPPSPACRRNSVESVGP